MALNNCSFVGRLVADAEVRTAGETEVANFTIAVDRNYVGKNKERETDFIRVVAWAGLSKFVSQWFHKGDVIAVTGELNVRNYEDKEGKKRSTFEIRANTLNFCGSKVKSDSDNSSKPDKSTDKSSNNNFEEMDDSNLPF